MAAWRWAASGLAVALVATTGAMLTGPGPARADSSRPYVKYYKVGKDYDGSPENLTEIATRFLADGSRSAEIYNLNAGRSQQDGKSLSDPGKLDAGWYLVMPWDAVGDGVAYGQLPAGKTTPTGTPKPGSTSKPNPGASVSPGASTSPTAKPGTSSSPAKGCKVAQASDKPTNWAQLRLAAKRAWGDTRGNGVMVAVVDSGVDSSVKALDGRVSVGADVTVGNGRGNTDCLGTGTAMAALIAGSSGNNDDSIGQAPDASILPVRIVSTSTTPPTGAAANAIEVAVSAGASVVAFGSYVDLGDARVVTAVQSALAHDVLIVLPAPTRTVTLPTSSSGSGALLTVGGVSASGQLLETYTQGKTDLVAPGADVESLGVGSTGAVSVTGTQYAVALAAGGAALARAAFPGMSAAQVRDRLLKAADHMGDNSDTRYGAGLIDAPGAITAAGEQVPADSVQSTAGQRAGAGRTIATVLFLLLTIPAVWLLLKRFRRGRYAAG